MSRPPVSGMRGGPMRLWGKLLPFCCLAWLVLWPVAHDYVLLVKPEWLSDESVRVSAAMSAVIAGVSFVGFIIHVFAEFMNGDLD